MTSQFDPNDPNLMPPPGLGGGPIGQMPQGMAPPPGMPVQAAPPPVMPQTPGPAPMLAPAAQPPPAAPIELLNYQPPQTVKQATNVLRNEKINQAENMQAQTASVANQGELEAQKQEGMANAKGSIAERRFSDAEAEQAYHDTLQSHIDRKQAVIDKDQQDLKDAKVDPDRYIHDMGTAQRISSMAAAVLSGFQGGMNGTGRNIYLESLDRDIDRDVSIQEKNIANKRASLESNKSALADYLKQGLTLSEAREHLKGNIYESLQMQAQSAADNADSQITRQKAMQAVEIFQAKSSEFRQAAAQQVMQQAQAAASAAAAQKKQQADQYFKLQELELKRSELGLKAAESGNKGAEALDKKVGEYGKALNESKVPENEVAIKNILERNPNLLKGDSLEGVSGFNLQRILPTIVASDTSKQNRQDMQALTLAYEHALIGGRAPPEVRKQVAEAFMGAKTPAEIQHAILFAEGQLNATKTTLGAAVGKEAVDEFNRRKGELPARPIEEESKFPQMNVVGKR